MHKKVKEYVEENHLIQEEDTLIIGTSGGADSMALLHYFNAHKEEYHIHLKVAHVHHGLRITADLDAALVENYCNEQKIPYYRHNCQISQLAKQYKISEEEAGRVERYRFFNTLAGPKDKIVTAHHMDDQAETILMRLVRGTGIRGLGGILPQKGNIIRPFLCLTRMEIEHYCEKYHIPYRNDETNQETKYTRNKIRLQLLPYLKENLNPSVVEAIARLGMLAKEADDFIEAQTVQHYQNCLQQADVKQISLNAIKLTQYPLYMQKSVVLYAIKQLTGMKDYTMTHIESCMNQLQAPTGKKIALPNGICFKKEYDTILFTKRVLLPKKQEPICQMLQLGTNQIDALGLKIDLIELPLYLKPKSRYTKCIDYEKVKEGLCLRTRTTTDYMTFPNGHKKLTRVMIDDKIPKEQRDSVLLLADGHEIIWIIGYRFSTHYYINNDTKKILQINLNIIEKLP